MKQKGLFGLVLVVSMLLTGVFAAPLYLETYEAGSEYYENTGGVAIQSFALDTAMLVTNVSLTVENPNIDSPPARVYLYRSSDNALLGQTGDFTVQADGWTPQNFNIEFQTPISLTANSTYGSYYLKYENDYGTNVVFRGFYQTGGSGSYSRGEASNAYGPISTDIDFFFRLDGEELVPDAELKLYTTVNGAENLIYCNDEIDMSASIYHDTQVIMTWVNSTDGKTYVACPSAYSSDALLDNGDGSPTFTLTDAELDAQNCVDNGYDCIGDPDIVCVSSLNDLDGVQFDFDAGDQFALGRNIQLNQGVSPPTNFTMSYEWVNPSGQTEFDAQGSITVDYPMLLPLRFYKDEAHSYLVVVANQELGACQTTDTLFSTAENSVFYARTRFNNHDTGDLVNFARYHEGVANFGENNTFLYNESGRKFWAWRFPLSSFSNGIPYTVSTNILRVGDVEGVELFNTSEWFTTYAVGQRGYVNGDAGGNEPFYLNESIDTDCDLRYYVPMLNGTCWQIAEIPTMPTGNFILTDVGFISALAALPMVLLVFLVIYDAKDGGKRMQALSKQFGEIFNKVK